MKVLITGAAGFIGANLCHFLNKNNHTIIGIDNLRNGEKDRLKNLKNNFSFIECDVRNLIEIEEVIKSVDAVVHLAALSSVNQSFVESREFFETNVVGTVNIFESAKKHQIKKIIYASSAATYGEADKIPIREEEILKPQSPYGYSKKFDEDVAQSYDQCFNIASVGLRFFNVYGPFQSPGSPYSGVITRWFDDFKKGNTPVIFGDGDTTRDFVFVEDVCCAIETILKTEKLNGSEIYNVGSGIKTSLKVLYQTIAQTLGKEDIKPVFEKQRIGDIRHSTADISKITKDFHFQPKFSLKVGIKTLSKSM